MKDFSFKMVTSAATYIWVVKDAVNEDHAFLKLQEFTNFAKNKQDFVIKELDMEVNSIN